MWNQFGLNENLFDFQKSVILRNTNFMKTFVYYDLSFYICI